nr:hypothetical protein [Candidatus Odyssella thessalonicensis]
MKTASPTFELENSISDNYHYIAGVDEAGCGPLAGPVVAAAVIFLSRKLPDHLTTLINDSKKLTEKNVRKHLKSCQKNQEIF